MKAGLRVRASHAWQTARHWLWTHRVLLAFCVLAVFTYIAFDRSNDQIDEANRSQTQLTMEREALNSYASCIRGNISRQALTESHNNLADLFEALSDSTTSPEVEKILLEAVPEWRATAEKVPNVDCVKLLPPGLAGPPVAEVITGEYVAK